MTPAEMDQFSYFTRYMPQTDRMMLPNELSHKKTKLSRSGSPRLTLTFEAKPDLDINVQAWYPITFTITRDADDIQRQPCIIHWDPIEDGFGQPGIMLLRYNCPFTNDLQPVQINSEQLQAKPLRPREIFTSEPCFKQLNPGVSVSWEVTLPSVYFDSFLPGQFYEIFWVGGQIHL